MGFVAKAPVKPLRGQQNKPWWSLEASTAGQDERVTDSPEVWGSGVGGEEPNPFRAGACPGLDAPRLAQNVRDTFVPVRAQLAGFESLPRLTVDAHRLDAELALGPAGQGGAELLLEARVTGGLAASNFVALVPLPLWWNRFQPRQAKPRAVARPRRWSKG